MSESINRGANGWQRRSMAGAVYAVIIQHRLAPGRWRVEAAEEFAA